MLSGYFSIAIRSLSFCLFGLNFVFVDPAQAVAPKFHLTIGPDRTITRNCNQKICPEKNLTWVIMENGREKSSQSALHRTTLLVSEPQNGARYEIYLRYNKRRNLPVSNTVTFTYQFASKNLLILLANFSDAAEPFPKSFFQSQYFDVNGNNPQSVRRYIEETSYGQTTVTGEVYGPFNLGFTASSSFCNTAYIQGETLNKFFQANPSYSLSKVDHLIVITGRMNCGWAGSAVTTPQLVRYGNQERWMGTMTINANATLHVLTHELLHNLGLQHTSSLDCGADVVQIPGHPFCQNVEYGDSVNIMDISSTYQLNAIQKAYLGWIPLEQIQTVTANGTYFLSPVEQLNFDSASSMLLKVPARKDATGRVISYFWIEYRQSIGYFDRLLPAAITSGVRVFLGTANTKDTPSLLDLTPETPNPVDGPLAEGMTFLDPVSNISIKAALAKDGKIGVTISGLVN